MAKSKRSSSQPSRQERRLARQRADIDHLAAEMAARQLSAGGGVGIAVPPGMEAVAARIWHEVTGGDGVTLKDGVPVEPGVS